MCAWRRAGFTAFSMLSSDPLVDPPLSAVRVEEYDPFERCFRNRLTPKSL